jgi:predicted DNA-binding protein with PD1-like motif
MEKIRIEISKGKAKHIAFVRILPHSEVVQSILQAFEKTGFQAAAVTNGIGSLEQACYTYITKNSIYHKPICIKEKCELLNITGFLAKNKNTIEYHFHAVMADSTGKVFGGHLLPEGSIVSATMELTLLEMDGVHIKKEFDEETGFTLFKVQYSSE